MSFTVSSSCSSVWWLVWIATTTTIVIILILGSETTTAAFVASPRIHHHHHKMIPQQSQLSMSNHPFDEFDYYYAPPSPTETVSSSASTPATFTTSLSTSSGAHARIVTLESHADLINFWNDNSNNNNQNHKTNIVQQQPETKDVTDHDQRIAVVLVHTKWCKSCHKVWEHYRKLAREYADGIDNRSGQVMRRGRLRLASMEWSAHTDLCRHVLGVTRLPTVAFYGPGGRVLESFAAGPTQFAALIQPTLERLWLEQRLEQGAALMEHAGGTSPSQSSSSSSSGLTPEQVAREWNWSNQKQ